MVTKYPSGSERCWPRKLQIRRSRRRWRSAPSWRRSDEWQPFQPGNVSSSLRREERRVKGKGDFISHVSSIVKSTGFKMHEIRDYYFRFTTDIFIRVIKQKKEREKERKKKLIMKL